MTLLQVAQEPNVADDRARDTIDAAAAGILLRLRRLPNLARVEVMSPAAAPSAHTVMLVQRTLESGRRSLERQIRQFRAWLRGPGAHCPVADAQRRYTVARLRWIGVLTQYDIYADALSQRSEHPIGVWLAGLDHLADDSLADLDDLTDLPEVMCYLDRGAGAAIRRARTRLPGGLNNPVAIIRVPRERMIGAGVGSSLVHEVGHQAAAQLCLVESLRRDFGARVTRSSGVARQGWSIYRRWVSEIVADFWSVGQLGIASTLGLIEVVSLPAPFVFRVSMTDPHPAPWLRVRLSIQIGRRLHPDPAWEELDDLWTARYPLSTQSRTTAALVHGLAEMGPVVAGAVTTHRSDAAGGRSLADLVPAGARLPTEMLRLSGAPVQRLSRLRPTLALAALGAARPAAQPDRIVEHLLTEWAMARYRDGCRS